VTSALHDHIANLLADRDYAIGFVTDPDGNADIAAVILADPTMRAIIANSEPDSSKLWCDSPIRGDNEWHSCGDCPSCQAVVLLADWRAQHAE
jgi:hypothetical protein